ncbi:MAG: hypothetical protein C5S44_02590 [Candidatus Methanocomedens sp.]|nr:MAG: hypothetical protein C5S44_02590 [ANME-2 cluster archaeon]
MAEIKVEDTLIPLLRRFDHLDEEKFNDEFEDIRTKEEPLYLQEKFGFSINFIHIITTHELKNVIKYLDHYTKLFEKITFSQQNQDNNWDSLDDLFLDNESNLKLERKIYISKTSIETELEDKQSSKKVLCSLFINIAEIKSKKGNELPYHIISVIPTSYNCTNINEDDLYSLSNEQIIKLISSNFYKFFKNVPGEAIQKEVLEKFEKGSFVAIQLWNYRWKNKKDNTFDTKFFVRKNPYYFYSILTLEKDVFRRTYENIMDVLGWCQSDSSVYFDVFYGNTCLELTTKPRKNHENEEHKDVFFDETGHDSEQFRIWEFLALQHKLLIEININDLKNVDNSIEELDLIYNFNTFTKKDGKREKWIRYVKYLQRITGIDSDYQDYKLKTEMKNKEHEQKLQKLNLLIVVSIFASFITLLLSPIYSSWVPTSLYFENIVKNPYREIKAIHLALILTYGSYLYVYKLKHVNIFEHVKLKCTNIVEYINKFEYIKLKHVNIFEYISKLINRDYSIYIKYLRIIFVISFIISFFGY